MTLDARWRTAFGAPAGTAALVAIVATSIAVIVLTGLPRFGALSEPGNESTFDHTTPGGRELSGLTIDMREYLRLTEYYSGDGEAPKIAPFTNRLAVPWLASRLPWDSPISFNVVSVALVCAGVVGMSIAQRRLRCSQGAIAVAALAYSLSFPVFYWSSFNYVDAAVVGLLGVLVALLVFDRFGAALLLLGVSVVFKEWALVGLLAVIGWSWFSTGTPSRWFRVSAAVGSTAAGYVITQAVAIEASEFYNPWLPSPSDMAEYVGWNLSRFGPLAQSMLTAVPLLAAVAVIWVKRHADTPLSRQHRAMLLAGAAGSALLAGYSFVAAQWDGRAIWLSYPFILTWGAVALSSGTTVGLSAEQRLADWGKDLA